MSGKQPKRIPRPGIDEYGRSPLLIAASEGNLPKVLAHLSEGAAIDLQDDDGWTALRFATQARSEEVVRVLLERGANPNLVDSHGNGPLWGAVMGARGNFGIIQLLIAAGASTSQKNKHGRSPRDMAQTIGHGLETVVLS